jgi:hypothetical protein
VKPLVACQWLLSDTLSQNGIFPVKPQRPFLSERKPEAKYGGSHFWLCVGQYGVYALACV